METASYTKAALRNNGNAQADFRAHTCCSESKVETQGKLCTDRPLSPLQNCLLYQRSAVSDQQRGQLTALGMKIAKMWTNLRTKEERALKTIRDADAGDGLE